MYAFLQEPTRPVLSAIFRATSTTKVVTLDGASIAVERRAAGLIVDVPLDCRENGPSVIALTDVVANA